MSGQVDQIRGPTSSPSRLPPDRVVAEGGTPTVLSALADEQFELHYQPVVDLVRREVVAVEALLRWHHPESGLLLPEQFLAEAEASRAVVDLGRWVLSSACSQVARWAEQGLVLDLAVNLSAVQVTHPDLAADVMTLVERSGLEASRLVLEITESVVTAEAGTAAEVLTDLHRRGVRLAIDDFGTGFSSLLHLERYPVSALKIDGRFVAGLGLTRDDDAIVASVIRLAQATGASCVAEGVETAEQLAQLEALGCDRAQGYLLGAPVSADDLPRLIDACQARLHATPRPGGSRPRRSPGTAIGIEVRERILQLNAAGASHQTIAAALNQADAPHPRGTRWHATAVARFLASAQPSTQRTGHRTGD